MVSINTKVEILFHRGKVTILSKMICANAGQSSFPSCSVWKKLKPLMEALKATHPRPGKLYFLERWSVC